MNRFLAWICRFRLFPKVPVRIPVVFFFEFRFRAPTRVTRAPGRSVPDETGRKGNNFFFDFGRKRNRPKTERRDFDPEAVAGGRGRTETTRKIPRRNRTTPRDAKPINTAVCKRTHAHVRVVRRLFYNHRRYYDYYSDNNCYTTERASRRDGVHRTAMYISTRYTIESY